MTSLPTPSGDTAARRSETETGEASTRAQIASIKRRSLIAAALIFGVTGSWSVLARISGAVIAPGFVVVESNARSVQHLTGGIVEQLLVREGQAVTASQLLVKLDETQIRAQLQILLTQIDELLVRQARLDAERTDGAELVLPSEIAARQVEPALQRIINLERIVLDSRRRALSGQRSQLEERMRQIELEAQGLNDQMKARERQAEQIAAELRDLEGLFARNLVPLLRVSGLRREQSRLQGDIGYLHSEIAKARARIAETELQVIQLEQQRRSEVTQEARDTASKLAEAQERRVALVDQLNRVEIRSPIDGVVHQLAVFTIGGVIKPGETLMRVVPDRDELTFEVRIQPRDIDQVSVGQAATVRLTAANQPTQIALDAQLTQVSPDIVVELNQPGQPRYFVGRVKVSNEALRQPNAPRLQPGMPAEVFIRTNDRTPLSFFLRPVLDQAQRAFRER